MSSSQALTSCLTRRTSRLKSLKPSAVSTVDVKDLRAKCTEAMNDDLNSPIVISHLFEAAKAINAVADGKATISAEDLEELKATYKLFVEDVLGLKTDAAEGSSSTSEAYKKAVDLLLNIRLEAKQNKDWATSDKIRNALQAAGFTIKDTKDGFEWSV